MPKLEVEYFALLRELALKEKEAVDAPAGSTYADLYRQLARAHRFPIAPADIQVAVDDEFTALSEKVRDGAKVVFIPPVAGG